jgi:DHA1 family putative efflux transporter-like MFS transporter
VNARSSLLPLVALTAATFAVGFGELVIAGILPAVSAGVHVSIAAAGQLTTVYALVFAVVSPPLAALFRGPRRRTGLILGLLIVAAANVLAVFVPAYGAVLVARMIAAVGSALASPLALALIDDVVPPARRGQAQGIVFAGFAGALTISLPVGALTAEAFGWRSVFVLVAALALVAAALGTTLRPEAAAPVPAAERRSARVLLDPAILRILAVSLFCLIAQYAVITYIRPLLSESGGYDLATSALLLLLFGAVGIAGNLAGGLAVDRWGIVPTMIVCLAVNLVVFLIMRVVGGPVAVTAILLVLWSLASWAFTPGVNAALATNAGEHRDVALAMNMTACNVGIAAGSALGGLVVATSGVRNTLLLGAAMLAIAIVLVIVPLGAPRQSPQPGARYS